MARTIWLERVCNFTQGSNEVDYSVLDLSSDQELYNSLLNICKNHYTTNKWKVGIDDITVDVKLEGGEYTPGFTISFTYSGDPSVLTNELRVEIGTTYDREHDDRNAWVPTNLKIKIRTDNDPLNYPAGNIFANFATGNHTVVISSDTGTGPAFVFGSHETGVSIFEGLRKRKNLEPKSNTISEILQEIQETDLNHVHSIGDYENFDAGNIAWVKGEIGPNGGPGDRNWHPDETEETESSGN